MPTERENSGGFYTADMRVRGGWFGIAIVEELIVSSDGTRKWRRAPGALLDLGHYFRWKNSV